MEEERDKLEKIYQKLNEEENTVFQKWYESLIPKTILLFPLLAFALTFLKVNTDKTILDLLAFIAIGGLLVSGGIFLNYLLSKVKWHIMYGIAITYGFASLILLGGFAYLTFIMTKKWLKKRKKN